MVYNLFAKIRQFRGRVDNYFGFLHNNNSDMSRVYSVDSIVKRRPEVKLRGQVGKTEK